MRNKQKKNQFVFLIAVCAITLAITVFINFQRNSDKHVCKFTDWRTASEPDCVNSGEIIRTCIGCGERESQILPALGHVPDYEGGEFVTSMRVPAFWYWCTREGCNTRLDAPLTVSETIDPGNCAKQGVKTTTYLVNVDGFVKTHTVQTELEKSGHTLDIRNAVWRWNDYTAIDCTVKCSACKEYTLTVDATMSERVVEPTCSTQGSVVYTAKVDIEGETYTATKIKHTGKLPHSYDYNNGTWTWDGLTATYTVICGYDHTHVNSISAEAELVNAASATCEADGFNEYKATVFFGGKNYSDTYTETLPATSHNYDFGNPVWTVGETESFITFDCLNDGTHPLRVDATVTKSITKEPTCETAGEGVFTAVAKYGDREYSKIDTVTLSALGHEFNAEDGAWVWEMHDSATFTVACTRGEGHIISLVSDVQSEHADPTCDYDGYDRYFATVTIDGVTITDEIVEYIPALGHDYVITDVEWMQGVKYFAQVSFVCTKDEEHEDMAIGEAQIIEEAAATCISDGSYLHIAEVELDGETYTVSKQIVVESPGHGFTDGYCSRCGIPEYSTGLEYELLTDGSGYAVIGIGSHTGGVVSIPVTYLDLPVKEIKDGAFKSNNTITEVHFSENIEKIGSEAFAYCRSLTKISFADVHASIESSAFAYCTAIAELDIPAGVYVLKDNAFKGCSAVKSLKVASKEICNGVFYGLNSLMEVEICEGVEKIGNSFATNGPVFTVTIPSTVTSIGNNMFDSVRLVEVKNLSSVEITPDSKSIYPFLRNLKNVYTATSGRSYLIYDFSSEFVYYIKGTQRILMGCMSWDGTELVLPTTYNKMSYSIYTKAFSHLTNVKKVVINGKVSSIGASAFPTSVTEIDIDENAELLTISDGAFLGTSITYLYIPKSVIHIGSDVFPSTLTEVEFAYTDGWLIVAEDDVYLDSDLIDTPAEAAAYLKENKNQRFERPIG